MKKVYGLIAVRGVFTDAIRHAQEQGVNTVCGITNLDTAREHFPELGLQSANPWRLQAKLSSRLIYCSNQGPILAITDEPYHRQSKHSKIPFDSDFTVIGDTVILTVINDEPVAYVITDKLLADHYRTLFELLWTK